MPVNEITFLRQIKVSIKNYNIIIKYSVRDLLSDANNYAQDPQSSNMRHIP